MYELTKCYRQSMPEVKFIGRKYLEKDRDEYGGYGSKWDLAWSQGDFDKIEQAAGGAEKLHALCEDGDATYAMMRYSLPERGLPFEYWVGMLAPVDTPVPDGMESVLIPAADMGVVWIHGDMDDLFAHEEECTKLCAQNGLHLKAMDEQNNSWYCFERYCCPRFTTPDEQGHVTVDLCIPVE